MVTTTAVLAVGTVALGMVLTPDPNMLYLVSRTLTQGRAAGLVSLGGVAAGFACYLLATTLGLTAIFSAVPSLYIWIKLLGALYLGWLAWQVLRPRGRSPFQPGPVSPDSRSRLFLMGWVTNLLNPKIAVMYVALIPQFVDLDAGHVCEKHADMHEHCRICAEACRRCEARRDNGASRRAATQRMESLMRKTLAAIALLATAGLTLTACGDDPDDATTGNTSSNSAFNDADVTFAQQMIPHHEQAVEMAELAQDRADSGEVLELAKNIEAAQAPEIDTLQGWLEEWGEEAPSDETDGMDHGDMGHGSSSEMPGMMDEDEMNDLMGASGADWDRMFLAMMIEHHEGAVEMAQVEVDDGENPDAVALAKKIISDQEAEITQMRELLDS